MLNGKRHGFGAQKGGGGGDNWFAEKLFLHAANKV